MGQEINEAVYRLALSRSTRMLKQHKRQTEAAKRLSERKSSGCDWVPVTYEVLMFFDSKKIPNNSVTIEKIDCTSFSSR